VFQELSRDSKSFKSMFQEGPIDFIIVRTNFEIPAGAPSDAGANFISRASRVSRVSRDGNSFQECFKSCQETARASRVSRACFKRDCLLDD